MSYLWLINCLFLFLFSSPLEAKVILFAHYFGQPEFVKYQHLLFKKNLLDDYNLVIVEDSNNPQISEEIKNECEKYGIEYLHIPRSVFEKPKLPILDAYVGFSSPSFECAVATQYIYDNYIVDSSDICFILDNDIFLLSPFSIHQYLEEKSFAYVKDIRGSDSNLIFYMLPNFAIFNPAQMTNKDQLNFNLGMIGQHRTDSGGYTYYYLRDHVADGKEMAIYHLHSTSSKFKTLFESVCPLLFHSKSWGSYYLIEKDLFLHIRMGSNWSNDTRYPQMKAEVATFLDSILAN